MFADLAWPCRDNLRSRDGFFWVYTKIVRISSDFDSNVDTHGSRCNEHMDLFAHENVHEHHNPDGYKYVDLYAYTHSDEYHDHDTHKNFHEYIGHSDLDVH